MGLFSSKKTTTNTENYDQRSFYDDHSDRSTEIDSHDDNSFYQRNDYSDNSDNSDRSSWDQRNDYSDNSDNSDRSDRSNEQTWDGWGSGNNGTINVTDGGAFEMLGRFGESAFAAIETATKNTMDALKESDIQTSKMIRDVGESQATALQNISAGEPAGLNQKTMLIVGAVIVAALYFK